MGFFWVFFFLVMFRSVLLSIMGDIEWKYFVGPWHCDTCDTNTGFGIALYIIFTLFGI